MELKRTLKYLKKDVWAQISAFYIFLVIVVATFAYQLTPDKTKNANQMHLSIHSKGPGFSCLLLIIPRDTSTTRKSFFNGIITSMGTGTTLGELTTVSCGFQASMSDPSTAATGIVIAA